MIQRIQTVYLVLGVLALGALILFNGAWHAPTVDVLSWFPPVVFGLSALAALVALVTVFLYKDPAGTKKMGPGLTRQRKFVVVAQMVTLALLVVLFVGLYLAQSMPRINDVTAMATLLLPVLAYILFYLARRSIDRDLGKIEKMNQFRLRD